MFAFTVKGQVSRLYHSVTYQRIHISNGKRRGTYILRGNVKITLYEMSLVLGIADFRICENKDAGHREADQRLCFRYIDSTIPFLP